jgi:hypothetical protein
VDGGGDPAEDGTCPDDAGHRKLSSYALVGGDETARLRSGYQPVNFTAPSNASTVAMIATRGGIVGTMSEARSISDITAKAAAQTAVIRC